MSFECLPYRKLQLFPDGTRTDCVLELSVLSIDRYEMVSRRRHVEGLLNITQGKFRAAWKSRTFRYLSRPIKYPYPVSTEVEVIDREGLFEVWTTASIGHGDRGYKERHGR